MKYSVFRFQRYRLAVHDTTDMQQGLQVSREFQKT